MSPDEIHVGLPVIVPCGFLPPGYRRGRVVSGPHIRAPDAMVAWRVEFPSGATALLTPRELEHPSAVDRLAAVCEEGRR